MTRWIIPVLGALAAHLLLFSFVPQGGRPMCSVAESRTVQLSLAAMPPAPQAARPAPPRLIQPKNQVVQKPRKIEPAPKVAAARPVRQRPPAPAARIAPERPPAGDTPTDPSALPADAASSLPVTPQPQGEAGQVQASVPLYDLNPPPVYPASARRRGMEGTVVLEVLVDRTGQPAQVRVLQSSGYDLLDGSALKSVRQWRFSPGRRMGRPQEMWVQVPVRFQLQ